MARITTQAHATVKARMVVTPESRGIQRALDSATSSQPAPMHRHQSRDKAQDRRTWRAGSSLDSFSWELVGSWSCSTHTSSYICSRSSAMNLACLRLSSKSDIRSSSIIVRFSSALRALFETPCNKDLG